MDHMMEKELDMMEKRIGLIQLEMVLLLRPWLIPPQGRFLVVSIFINMHR